MAIFTLVNFGLYLFLLLRVRDLTGSMITAIALGLLFNFVWALFSIPFGSLSDKIGRKETVILSSAIAGFLLFTIGFEMALIVLMLLLSMQRFLFGILQPSFRALQADLVPEVVRGKEFGIVQAFSNFGSVLGPIIGWFLYDWFFMHNFHVFNTKYFGAGVPFIFAGILSLLACVLLILLIDYKKHKISVITVE